MRARSLLLALVATLFLGSVSCYYHSHYYPPRAYYARPGAPAQAPPAAGYRQDLLELNRLDRVQPDSVRLGAFVETFLDEFAQNAQIDRSGFALSTEGDGVVEFDRVHLNQILWNLARNGRHSQKRPGSVRLRIHRQGNRLELVVVDDGPGVEKELQGQLFEPFFTTYSAGTGLGLFIARELCAANGATLDYIDRPAGAEFRIAWLGIRQ